LSNDFPLNPPLNPYPEGPRPVPPTRDGRRPARNRIWLHVVLFVLTLASTTCTGAQHYAGFIAEFGRRDVVVDASLFVNGLWYSGTILAILTAHEMGHYLYCRWYGLDASLPYFLPFPSLLTGTLGAVIRIREPFRNKTQLFDVGIAGPIGGMIVLVPALFLGLSMSSTVPVPTEGSVWNLGEPLLFQWAVKLSIGPIAEGHTVNMHPVVFACWFGMLATALNLIPFGQFDGGHILYAVFGDRVARIVSASAVLGAALLVSFSWTWALPAALMLMMWRTMGLSHPSPLNPFEPISPGRRAFAVTALIAFLVCFTPAPLSFEELVKPVGPGRSAALQLQHIDRIDVDDSAPLDFRPRVECRQQRPAHGDALFALDEELRSVFSLQAAQRRGGRAEHAIGFPAPSQGIDEVSCIGHGGL
jgi:Zn-dependent protease